jgi:hypothetical protein
VKGAITLIVFGVAMTTAYGLTLQNTVFALAGPLLLIGGVVRLLLRDLEIG